MAMRLTATEIDHHPLADEILTPEAIAFVADLERRFRRRRDQLLRARAERQVRIDRGERPDFLAETAHVRTGDWTVAPYPAALADRRVEITGPVERKMMINAFNSGARCFMADFDDANSPTWDNVVTACSDCNRRKGGRTPEQAGLKLVRPPQRPQGLGNILFSTGLKAVPDSWRPYLTSAMSRRESS